MKRHRILFLVLLSVAAFPQYAWADAGTPLMWATGLHLLLGNALIGVAEGLLLGWLFSVPKRMSVPVLILANYASAWLGGVFIGSAIARALPMDLNNGWTWFWVMVVVTWCITLILEWPFFALCCRGKQDWLKRSMQATIVLVSASYVVLFGWYWMASGTSLYTEMHIVAPARLSLPDSVVVYYIAAADGNVYKRPLVGGSEQKVYELHSTNTDDRLFVRPNAKDKNHWDLVARLETTNVNNPRFVDVLTSLPVEAAPDWPTSQGGEPPDSWFNFGEVPEIGSATSSRWKFRTGFWPLEGLRGSNKTTGESVGFSYETPYGAWRARNAVQLPSDKVLFQLGDDQICAFDPVTRRVALLWRGRGPAPVIGTPNIEPTAQQPKELTLDCGKGVSMKMVLIPAGEFLMGGDEPPEQVAQKCNGVPAKAEWFQNEQPQHRVKITKPFYMGVYVVTQAQYEAVTGNNPSHFKGEGNPVEEVSWNDAVEFCKKLSAKTGQTVRLPTEAEWEYACRAGTTTPFNTGETISTDQANYNGNHTYGSGNKGEFRQKTVAVGSFKANAWGLYDMHGNVWEWCQDWNDAGYYKNNPTNDTLWNGAGYYKNSPTGRSAGAGEK